MSDHEGDSGAVRPQLRAPGIPLPPEDVKEKRRGKILAAGWAICYLFGTDEQGEYLDY